MPMDHALNATLTLIKLQPTHRTYNPHLIHTDQLGSRENMYLYCVLDTRQFAVQSGRLLLHGFDSN